MKSIYLGAASLLLGLAPLVAHGANLSDAKSTVQQKLYEITGKDTAVLSFPAGATRLTSGDETTLKSLLNAVREGGPVKEILVMAYSDQAYPHNQKDDLSAAARDLADARGDAVKKGLENLGAEHVKVHNMAKKAGWFEKTFVTTDAQLKREAVEKPSHTDLDDEFYQALGQRLKTEGGAGKAVVVIRREGTYAH
jgi:hypothetical protein